MWIRSPAPVGKISAMARDRVDNPLDDTTRTAPAARPPGASGRADDAYLVVLAGSNVGEMYKLEKEQNGHRAAARRPTSAWSTTASRASTPQLVKEGGQVVLEDLGSTNGTYCNGDARAAAGAGRGRQDPARLDDDPEVQLPGQAGRGVPAPDVRVGAARRADPAPTTSATSPSGSRASSSTPLRHDAPLSLIFLDIDHFKRINDVHGHQAGDHVLAQLATLVTSMLGEDEIFARYGGEEFAIVARGMELAAAAGAVRAAARQRRGAPVRVRAARRFRSPSASASRARPRPGIGTPADLVARADETMYAAKRAGRNRVCVATAAALQGPDPSARSAERRGLASARARRRAR